MTEHPPALIGAAEQTIRDLPGDLLRHALACPDSWDYEILVSDMSLEEAASIMGARYLDAIHILGEDRAREIYTAAWVEIMDA